MFRTRQVSLTSILVLLAGVIGGCATYSPFLNLPSEPLAKGDGEAGASLSGLTQTGSTASIQTGVEGFVRYGFSNTFSLGLRTWTDDFEFDDGVSFNGVSADGLFNLSDSTAPTRFGIASRLLFLFSGRTLEANGLIVDGVAWLPDVWRFKPYLAAGGGIGFDLDPGPDEREVVVIATFHGGTSINLFSRLEGRFELASVTEFNSPEEEYEYRWWLVPSGSLVWRF